MRYLSDVLHSAPIVNSNPITQVVLFGEFAGQGIMKGVAVSEIEKSFFAFGLYYLHEDGSVTKSTIIDGLENNNLNIYNIFMFDNKTINIDFNNTGKPSIKLLKILSVEEECPVGKHFGISGVGEGVVLLSECGNYIFKSKGRSIL